MAQGNVSVNNLNLGQGPVVEIERFFLFIGPAAHNIGKLIALNTQSNLDSLLGAGDSDLKWQVQAARANGGPRWACLALPLAADDTWQDALALAEQESISVEAVVITKPVTTGDELSAMQAASLLQSNRYGRRLFMMAATPGISQAQDWTEYLAAQRAITRDVTAGRVLAVPQLHGNDLGVLAGRLANAQSSVADSPMRVASGPLVGLGKSPRDTAGVVLSGATLAELDKARLSVPQAYPDYPGFYWGDANLLDAPGSDFTVIENLRIVDKAARRVRLLLIQRVADRKVNNTPNSMAATKTALMRPLRDMARSATFGGVPYPGDIQSPRDDDIALVWKNRTTIEAYLRVRPYNCPKDLTANIALDLSLDEE